MLPSFKTIIGLTLFVGGVCGSRLLPSCSDTDVSSVICYPNETHPYLAFEPPEPWPCQVHVRFDFQKISSLDVNAGTVTVLITIWYRWEEPRLSVFNNTLYTEIRQRWSTPIPEKIGQLVWNPRVQINDKKFEEEVQTGLLNVYSFPWRKHIRFMTWRRSLVTVWCNITNLDEYPFDSYKCKFTYENMDGNRMFKVNLTTFPGIRAHVNGTTEEFDYVCGKIVTTVLWGNFTVSI